MIHVCYVFNDKSGRYSKFTGTSILSLFENTKSTVIAHIVHDNTLSQDNRDKLISIAENYNQKIEFYNIDKTHAVELDEIKKSVPDIVSGRFSIGTIFRLFLPEIISDDIEKIIYLDSDIIVNLDISELWRIDLGDKPFGAVTVRDNFSILGEQEDPEKIMTDGVTKWGDVLNSGVMSINLKELRKQKRSIIRDIIWFVNNIEYAPYLDQEILNYYFSRDYLKLPMTFNSYVWIRRKIKLQKIESLIYHYVGCENGLGTKDVYNWLFFKYFVKTPWFNENIFGNIADAVQQMHNEHQTFMIEVSKMMANKERAFFTEHVSVKHVKKTFLITDEEIISTEENENLQDDIDAFTDSNKIQGALEKFLNSMKNSRGKKVYFLLVSGYYYTVCEILQSQGFEENKDFINGDLFRSESSGEPLNTYPIVKNI